MSIGRQQVMLPRFFSMTDAKPMALIHRDYSSDVQAYFHRLFPRRQWKVFRDISANPLPIDVELLYPTVEEPFYLLHTMGMSAIPMTYPTGDATQQREVYSELCLMLSSTWPFRQMTLDDSGAWPIWLLMELGRFPHVHHIWMSYGFVLPHGEQSEPISPMTKLSGVVMVQFEGELGEMTMHDGTVVNLLMPVLLYKNEVALCDSLGVDAVVDRILESNNGSFLLDMKRPPIKEGRAKGR